MNKKLYFCTAIPFILSPHIAVNQHYAVTELPVSTQNDLSAFPC